uniref:Fibrinogen C-terminal domain-containing protein n=1 Tax=Plectus sambesii TaxID=2011161 RepID=A0A914UQW9_9BILA
MYYSNNMHFTTFDTMKNPNPGCHQLGGWWLDSNGCAHEALNGKYIPSAWTTYQGFYWDIGTVTINPKQSSMMLRSILSKIL